MFRCMAIVPRLRIVIVVTLAAAAGTSAPSQAQVVTLGYSATAVRETTSDAFSAAFYSVPAFSTSLLLTSGVTAANVSLGTLTGAGDRFSPGPGSYSFQMPFNRPITLTVDGGAPVSFVHTGSVSISGNRGGSANQYNYYSVFATLSSSATPDAVYDLDDGGVLTADYHSAIGSSNSFSGYATLPLTADLTYYAPGTYAAAAAAAAPEPDTLALMAGGLLAASAAAYRMRRIQRGKA
jgi:hypothetical protein